jgi:hypothetical protein
MSISRVNAFWNYYVRVAKTSSIVCIVIFILLKTFIRKVARVCFPNVNYCFERNLKIDFVVNYTLGFFMFWFFHSFYEKLLD